MGIAVLLLAFGIAAVAGGASVARSRVRDEFGEVTDETREQASSTPGVVPAWAMLLVLTGWAALIGSVAIALLTLL